MASKRRKSTPPAEKDDSFNVLFVSLNMILLSFFILLNSIAVRDNERVRKALGSLLGTFGILEGGHSARREGESVLPSDAITVGTKPPRILEDELELLLRRLKKKSKRQDVKVVYTADNLEMELADEVLFLPGGVELNPEVFGLLDRIARLMTVAGRSVKVQGFSDPSQPVNYPSNLELSGCRAARVARYLVEAGKMPRERIFAQGMGEKPEGKHRRFVKIMIPSDALSRSLHGGT